MKKITLIALSIAMLAGCAKERNDNSGSPFRGRQPITLSFEAECPQTWIDSKVAISSENRAKFTWVGNEKISLIFGVTGANGADNSKTVTLESTASGVFSGTFAPLSGFSIAELQGFVLPAENGAYFNWVNADQSRINMNIPSSQTQAKVGEPNWTYIPFFYDLSAAEVRQTAENAYVIPNGVKFKSAADMIQFNIYGRHDEQVDGEKFKSIAVTAGTYTGVSKTNIAGTAERILENTGTSVNSNGTKTITVSLTEDVTIDGLTKDNGLLMYAGICLGGKRGVVKVVVTTDKATYTKTVQHTFPQKNVTKFTVHQIGINLANGYVRAEK